MPSPRLGSGFLQLEEREVPSTVSPDFTVMLDTLGVSAQVRTALLDIHDTNAPLATSLLETHTSLSALEHSVVSLSGSQTYNGIGSVPHTTAPHFAPFLTEGFSLSMDIKPTHNTYGAIVSKYDSSISDRAFHLAMDNTGRLVFTVYAPGLTRGIETSSPVLSLNTWQHVQVSFNPETQAMTITVNDTAAPTSTWASATIRTLTNGASPIRIGSDVGGNGNEGDAFFGEIKNVQLSALNTAPQEPLRTQRTLLLSQLSALELDADLLDLTHGIQVDAPPITPPLTLLDASHPFTGQGSTPAIAANHFLPFTKNFSLHAQINPTELAYGAIASKYESSIGDRAFHFALESDGKLTLYLYGQGLVRGIQTTAPIITTNAWQTVSASFKASTQAMEITVNGQVIPTTLLIDNTISELNHGPAALRIGSAVGGNGSESGFFPGQIRLASLTAFGEADPAVVQEPAAAALQAPAPAPLNTPALSVSSQTPQNNILSLNEQDTRTAIAHATLDVTAAQAAIAKLQNKIETYENGVRYHQNFIAPIEAEIRPYLNDPNNRDFVGLRQGIIATHQVSLRADQAELIIFRQELPVRQADLAAAESRLQAITDHLATFVGPAEAEAFAAWVTARYSEARTALPEATFQEWSDRFAENHFASAPLIYKTYDLAEPVVIRGFEENALVISGLSREVDATVRACLQESHPELFGANTAEDLLKAKQWATANGTNLDFPLGAQQRIRSETAQALLWMNEHIGPVVSFVFQEMLKQKLGLPLNTTVTDPIRQILWGQAFAKVHMSGVSGSCIPTNDEIRASVRTNFDALYAAYARMHGEQQSFYAGSQYWGSVPFTQATHTEATKQQIKAVEASTGGVGTVEERLLNMQRTFPAEFAELAAQVRAGTLVMGPIAEAFLLGNKTIVDNQQGTGTVVTAEQEFGEVLGETGGVNPLLSGVRSSDQIDRPDQVLSFGKILTEGLEQQHAHSLQYLWDAAPSAPQPSFPVRSDIAAGRVFLGMLTAYKNGHISQQNLATGAHILLGIPASEITTVRNTQNGLSADDLKTIFIKHGFAYLFSNAPTLAPSGPYIRSISTRVSFSGQDVSVSLDTGGGVRYTTGDVYVRNEQGQRVSSTPILSFKDTLTVDISSQRIASLYGGAVHGNFTLEVILKDASGHEFSGTRLSSSIPVDTLHPLKNLSTNADERTRTIENYIFSNALFPLENPSTWHQTLGSDNHHDSEFNAFDLNLNVDDGGQIVHAMAAGTISGIGFYAGGASHVDIRHEADVMIGGQMQHIVWISRYLHIAMKEATDSNGVKSYTMSYAGGSVTLTKDMYIEQGQIIGGVSNLGAESNHFHGDVHIVANGVQQDAIDFNPYLRDLGVGARADITAQGEKTLAWDENAHEWSYATLGLYYHRNLDGSKHFLAMTSGKEEVEWKTIPSVQLADGTQVSNYKAWIYIDPTGLVWEWKNGTWLSIHVL